MTAAATGKLVALQRTPSRRASPVPLDQVEVRADWGVEGDRHARPGSGRQVVVVEGEVLDDLDLVPGQLREQLTVTGMGAGAGATAKDGRRVQDDTGAVSRGGQQCASIRGQRRNDGRQP